MKPQFGLLVAGLLMLFTPGCCLLSHIFGCHHFDNDSCGATVSDDGCHHSKKCARKCRKCRECLEKHGGGDYGGMMMGDVGMGGCGCGGGMIGDCGCGGGMMSGGCASCGQGGMGSLPGPMPIMSSPGLTPSSEAAPAPTSGINLNYPQAIPAIPPSETGSTTSVPQGTQQVSVEEFQRLPGVVISGPTAVGAPASQPAMASSVATTTNVVAPAQPVQQPVQQAAAKSISPATARQVQQTGWAPVRK